MLKHASSPDWQPRGNEAILARCVRWLELAVIGLNLCPFAKAVHVKNQILWRISYAQASEQVGVELEQLLQELDSIDPEKSDTAVLVLPWAFDDFADYNDFLNEADRLLESMDFDGVFQIASFHPDYCFVDSQPTDLSNATNQAPYPLLHVLREASVTRVADNNPDIGKIIERNQLKLKSIGSAGWLSIRAQFREFSALSNK